MIFVVLWVVWMLGLSSVCFYLAVWRGKDVRFFLFLGGGIGDLGMAIYSIIIGQWAAAVVPILCAALFFWMAWKFRPPRNRKKVLKLIGAKARAIRDKMVAAMPKPRVVAVPV